MRKKATIIIYIFFLIVAISLTLTYARYSNSILIDMGQVHTAKYIFNLENTTLENKLTLDPLKELSKDYSFQLTNYNNESNVSEVSQKYTIDITSEKAFPKYLNITIDGVQGVTSDYKNYHFENNLWIMPHSESKTNQHVLSFSIQEKDINEIYEDIVLDCIKIIVKTEQID